MAQHPPDQPARGDEGGSLSSTLLQGLRARDPGAWQRLVDLYSPLVYRWCKRWGVHGDDLQDLIQEIFLAAFQSLDRFHRDCPGDTFRGWLYSVAQNTWRNEYRRRGRRLESAPGGTDALRHLQLVPDPEAGLGDDDALQASDRALLFRRAAEQIRHEFEETTWRMFWRAAVEEQAPADIAADFGVSAAAVRMAKSRVLRRLREEVGDLLLV